MADDCPRPATLAYMLLRTGDMSTPDNPDTSLLRGMSGAARHMNYIEFSLENHANSDRVVRLYGRIFLFSKSCAAAK